MRITRITPEMLKHASWSSSATNDGGEVDCQLRTSGDVVLASIEARITNTGALVYTSARALGTEVPIQTGTSLWAARARTANTVRKIASKR